jgi:uncharacterized membrane protein YoaK (UPF0700 family)
MISGNLGGICVTASTPATQQRTEERTERPDFGFALSAGVLLALNAGFVNAIGLLSLFNLAVSHVTGSTSNMGTAIARGDLVQVGTLVVVIASYFSGNVIAGFVVNDEELKPGHRHRYGLVLLVQTVSVVAAIWFFKQERILANYALAIACGVQNGMATRYSGATVRTSHMTGLVTDLGILLGQRLRGTPVGLWRVQLLAALFAAFLGGGILAGVVFQSWGYRALWLSAIGTGLAGLSYSSHHLFARLSGNE